MHRLAYLIAGGLAVLGVACSNPTPQTVTSPTSVEPTPTPTPTAPSVPTAKTIIVFTPPSAPLAGTPASFSFSVTGVQLKDLTVAWGDQTVMDVGAATQGMLTHVYVSAGAYTLTITAQGVDGSFDIASSGPLQVR